jgi:hypothetical protein
VLTSLFVSQAMEKAFAAVVVVVAVAVATVGIVMRLAI